MDLDAERLRELLDALEIGVGLLDADGSVLYANRTLAAIFGRRPDELSGLPLADALPGLDREIDWSHAASNAVERGRTLRLARHALPNGTRIDCTVGPLGSASLALLSMHDVSEMVRGEARMLLQTKTQAIANLGESVAHEIRNPLNSIHMNMQLLRESLAKADPESIDHTAATVQREIKRLDRVVRDFVKYSRPPALMAEPSACSRTTAT